MTTKVDLKCPDCSYVAKTPYGVTRHRTAKHGFVTPNAIQNKEREERRANGALWKRRSREVTVTQEPMNGARRKSLKTISETNISEEDGQITEDEYAQVLYAVGRLEGLCHQIAFENGFPAKLFARRCAQYFSLAARR